MLRNSSDCATGVILFQDVVQSPELQWDKKFSGSDTHLPSKATMTAGAAEALRQAGGAGVIKGGWLGGDAWFGSVMVCVELMLQRNVTSTWVIKNNTHLFPKAQLMAVLKARSDGGKVKAGTWASMTATIAGVKVCAIVYAWSKKGISFFATTVGDTTVSPTKYATSWEDEYGRHVVQHIDRPRVIMFLYKFVSDIDEHNRQRQSLLNLEGSWPTKNCWEKLWITVVGMCVVDHHRLCKYRDLDTYKDVPVVDFSDMICEPLEAKRKRDEEDEDDQVELAARSPKKSMSDRRVCHGNTKGSTKQGTCWICRMYQKRYVYTSYFCADCGTPICKQARGRTSSCAHEHKHSINPLVVCTPGEKKGIVPRKLIKF
jgi:hypothetical protein